MSNQESSCEIVIDFNSVDYERHFKNFCQTLINLNHQDLSSEVIKAKLNQKSTLAWMVFQPVGRRSVRSSSKKASSGQPLQIIAGICYRKPFGKHSSVCQYFLVFYADGNAGGDGINYLNRFQQHVKSNFKRVQTFEELNLAEESPKTTAASALSLVEQQDDKHQEEEEEEAEGSIKSQQQKPQEIDESESESGNQPLAESVEQPQGETIIETQEKNNSLFEESRSSISITEEAEEKQENIAEQQEEEDTHKNRQNTPISQDGDQIMSTKSIPEEEEEEDTHNNNQNTQIRNYGDQIMSNQSEPLQQSQLSQQQPIIYSDENQKKSSADGDQIMVSENKETASPQQTMPSENKEEADQQQQQSETDEANEVEQHTHQEEEKEDKTEDLELFLNIVHPGLKKGNKHKNAHFHMMKQFSELSHQNLPHKPVDYWWDRLVKPKTSCALFWVVNTNNSETNNSESQEGEEEGLILVGGICFELIRTPSRRFIELLWVAFKDSYRDIGSQMWNLFLSDVIQSPKYDYDSAAFMLCHSLNTSVNNFLEDRAGFRIVGSADESSNQVKSYMNPVCPSGMLMKLNLEPMKKTYPSLFNTNTTSNNQRSSQGMEDSDGDDDANDDVSQTDADEGDEEEDGFLHAKTTKPKSKSAKSGDVKPKRNGKPKAKKVKDSKKSLTSTKKRSRSSSPIEKNRGKTKKSKRAGENQQEEQEEEEQECSSSSSSSEDVESDVSSSSDSESESEEKQVKKPSRSSKTQQKSKSKKKANRSSSDSKKSSSSSVSYDPNGFSYFRLPVPSDDSSKRNALYYKLLCSFLQTQEDSTWIARPRVRLAMLLLLSGVEVHNKTPEQSLEDMMPLYQEYCNLQDSLSVGNDSKDSKDIRSKMEKIVKSVNKPTETKVSSFMSHIREDIKRSKLERVDESDIDGNSGGDGNNNANVNANQPQVFFRVNLTQDQGKNQSDLSAFRLLSVE